MVRGGLSEASFAPPFNIRGLFAMVTIIRDSRILDFRFVIVQYMLMLMLMLMLAARACLSTVLAAVSIRHSRSHS